MVYTSGEVPREAAEVLEFWFGRCVDEPMDIKVRASFWFQAVPAVDLEIAKRFEALVRKAGRSALDHWLRSPQGTLALVITLDQFPRNVYRGSREAFAYDARACAIAVDALARDLADELHPVEQCFLVMPLEHAENRELQEQSVAAIERAAAGMPHAQRVLLEGFVKSAEAHRAIVRRFGRFPHRNAILERVSTVAEEAFLKENPGGFGQSPSRESR